MCRRDSGATLSLGAPSGVTHEELEIGGACQGRITRSTPSQLRHWLFTDLGARPFELQYQNRPMASARLHLELLPIESIGKTSYCRGKQSLGVGSDHGILLAIQRLNRTHDQEHDKGDHQEIDQRND